MCDIMNLFFEIDGYPSVALIHHSLAGLSEAFPIRSNTNYILGRHLSYNKSKEYL